MPEGHTIHRLARRFRRDLGGHRVAVSSPQGRFTDGAALLDGTHLVATDAHGKHLFLGFGPADAGVRGVRHWLRVHLGLYGAWTIEPLPGEGPPEPQGAVRVRLVTAELYADLRGPAACEVVTAEQKDAVHARLGPDPLRRDADPQAFVDRVTRSAAPVATLLMDQAVIAGVGNVYRAEVLFRAGVHAHVPGRDLPPEVVRGLWDDLVDLLREGVRRGQIVTVPATERPRRRGEVPRDESWFVYRRAGQPCRRCGTPVAVGDLAARRLYWCPGCQGAPSHV